LSGTWDEQCDVVAVGSGIGGLSAAIVSADHGLATLVIEKSNQHVGGITGQSGGHLWVGAGPDADETDSFEDTLAYLDHMSVGLGDRSLRALFARRAPEALEYFMSSAGLRASPVPSLPDYYYPFAAGSKKQGRLYEPHPFPAAQLGSWRDRLPPCPTGGFTTDELLAANRGADLSDAIAGHKARGEVCAGSALAAYFMTASFKRGLEIRPSTRAVELIRENGRVTGLVVEQGGATRRISARRGVVLATGGYDWNADLVAEYDGVHDVKSLALPTLEGDSLVLAGELGAAMAFGHAPLRTFGCRMAGLTEDGKPRYGFIAQGRPHAMIVNRDGRRFSDESFTPSYRQALPHMNGSDLRFSNWPAWVIFDQAHVDRYGFAGIAPGEAIPEDLATRAESLTSLASILGIDQRQLQDTVTRFNGFCASGVDEDFGRGKFLYANLFTGDTRHQPNPNLGEIAQAPFYGAPLVRMGTGTTNVGLVISHDAEVLDVRRRPIPGLYAAGNSVGPQDLPVNYNSGIMNSRGMLYGYLAGLHIGGRNDPAA